MKKNTKNINGILLLDKPLDMTSNGALQQAKHLFGAKKAGHTGSLDPKATGMLPICFGEATKFSQFLLESDKCYEVIVKLGIKTATGDTEGQIIAQKPVVHITPERIEEILMLFRGRGLQVPPMFSAIKHQGKPLYELARQGIEIKRVPRPIHIYSLELKDHIEDILKLNVHCSKGTYIRTLAEDIGEHLGCGAHVFGLRRSLVQPYQQTNMVTFKELEDSQQQKGDSALQSFLLPIETSVQAFPAVQLSASALFYLRTGQPVTVQKAPPQGMVRVFANQNQFLGVGEILEDGRVAPRRLVNF